jgi:hypothetical protein
MSAVRADLSNELGAASWDERARIRQAQERAGPVFAAISEIVPNPTEPEMQYRARLAERLQPYIEFYTTEKVKEQVKNGVEKPWTRADREAFALAERWKDQDLVRLARVSRSAFENAERHLYEATKILGDHPTALPARDGGLRARKIVDFAGNESVEFHGDPIDCWGPFMTPSIAAGKITSGPPAYDSPRPPPPRRIVYPPK